MPDDVSMAELLQKELIAPLLPAVREAFADTLKKKNGRGGVRDLRIAELILEAARDIAVKQTVDARSIRSLLKTANELSQPSDPLLGDGGPFGDLRKDAEEARGNANGSTPVGSSVPDDLGSPR